ncbi:TPA: hypothetical protein ACH3X2_011529 [Trebouxia sp. C0005]
MWIQHSQHNKLKGLSSDARTPVLQFLQARPTLIRTLKRDSPHLEEAFKLAVDAIGQPYETEQWETLAEILMEACIANPAASMELHEVLYGVITPAGNGFSWGQNALKKLMSPITSIVGFGQQAFRNNQPRDFKQSVSQSESDSDDFLIGTSRSDSMESQSQAEAPAPSAAAARLPARHASVSINEPAPASERLGAADVSPLAKSAVSSNVPAKSGSPSLSTTDKGKRIASTPSHPLEQHTGSTAPVPAHKPATPAVQASPSDAASSQQTADARKQPNAASSSGRLQPTVSESKQLETQEAAQAPEASSSQAQAVHDERFDQSDAEKQRQSAAGSSTTSSDGDCKPPPLETLRRKRRERPSSIPIPADASSASTTLSPRGPSKRASTAGKPPLHPSPLDTGADQEPWFPMPIRTPRVSLALPSQDRSPKRRVPLDPFLASLPDPKKMTEKELLEFDFGAIERRLEELSRKNKTGKYPLPSFSPPKGLGPDFSPSASAAASVADAFNKYDELDTEDLPSLSSWLADTESTLRDPDWGASLGPTDVPLMNGLPPPSVLQAQLRELTSQASVIPSRLDQLKLRKVPTASSPESPSTVQSKNSPDAVPEVLPAAAAATGTASNEKEEADALLVELMEPAQRQPYREFKRDMEERAKAREAARLRGIHTTLPDLAPGAVPSLEAARNALETFQKERMATVGSVSEPLARAQAQLAELEVSLAKDRQQPLPWAELEASLRERNSPPTRDSAARITDAAKPHLEAARRSREARKAAWAAYKEKDSLLPEDFKRRMDEVYNPSEEHTAAVAAAVKLGVEDFKSGRVANRSEAVRARVSEVYKRRDPLLQFPKDRVPYQAEASEGPSSAFDYRSSDQISPPPEVFKSSLPTVAEGSSVTHLDPEVDIPDPLDLSPPLGSVPMLPGLRGIQRPTMRPSKPRGARPGRGPVPVPSTTHPEARPYGVARSSLALREQAQLQVEQPGALLMPPRHKSASSDKCAEKLPTPEAAVNLLAQVHSAEKRFETTLPYGKPPIPIVTAATVLGADAVDQTMVAKFVKESALVPQNPAKPAFKSAAQGSIPQAGLASPQAASHDTEPAVAAAAATVSEPAADAAAPAARKAKKVKAAGTQPSSSVAQPQAQAPAASQPAGLPTQSPSDARAEQSGVPAATQPAFKDQAAPVPTAAVASASAAPIAAVPSASSATATASSAVQPEAHLVRPEAATEGSLSPPDADPSSPTGEQASASKQGKQRMGKKQREKQRQEAAAKALEDARIQAEQDAEQAAKDAARAAKDAEYAEKRRIIQENVDKAKRNESEAAAALAAAKAIEDAAKQAAPAASEVEDAAAQAAAEEAKQAKKQAKKQRKREEAKAAKLALAAKVADEQQADATQAQDQAGPSASAAASEAAVPAAAAPVQSASGKATLQPAQPADQNISTVQSAAAADSHQCTPSRAGNDSLQLASPAVPLEAHCSLPDNLRPRPKPGKKGERQGKAKNAPVAMPDVDVEPSSEEPSGSQQQQQPSEAGTSQASSDFNAFLDSIGQQQQQSVFAAQEDYRSALHDQREESADNWTTVNGPQQRRQPAEAVQESEEDWIAVSGAQQHRHSAEADHASAEPWTTVASHQQQRHPIESQEVYAYAHQEDNGSELPMDSDQHDNGPIGLALLDGPPQRRRGTRAGKRHKKRYGDAAQRAQAQAVRDYVHASTWSDNDSDSTAGDRLQAHHPRTPLAAGHTTSDIGSPVRASSGPAPPPGLHRMNWAAAARGGDGAGALPKEGADAIVRQLKAQQEEEAAKAAELDLGERPKPKPRNASVGSAANRAPRVPAASDEAVVAAHNAALAATAGIVQKQPRRPKETSASAAASPAPWGYTGDEAAEGSGDGMWETAEPPSAGSAWEQPKQGRKSRQEPAPEAVPLPAPAVAAPNADLAIPAAELAEILHEELEENFCCPLTLDILQDPVKAADGRTYEREDITKWLREHDTSPMTNMPMLNKELAPDRELIRKMERLQRRITAAERRAEGDAA